MISSTSTPSSTSSIHPTRWHRRGILYTLDMAARVSWCTHQCLWRMRANPGCTQTSLGSITSLSGLPPIPNRSPSLSCGCAGCNATKMVLTDQTLRTTPGFLLFRGPASLETRLTLLIHPTSSALATSSLPLHLAEHVTSSIHPLPETHRGIGVLTIQTGIVRIGPNLNSLINLTMTHGPTTQVC